MKDFWFKIGAVALAIISPFILIFFGGKILPSLSSYWMTDLQPLFIVTNAITSYYMFSAKRWRVSSLFLLLLTAFSVELFPQFHNVTAIIFFLANLYPMFTLKRFRWVTYVYLATLPIFFYSILWGEVIAIVILAGYHGAVLYNYRKINTQRQHIHQSLSQCENS
jgi:hypothetical protein